MERFLVISNHTVEDCKLAIKYFSEYNATYLTHFDWGCFDNDHNAYAIIEADNHEQARMSVPPMLRNKSKVIKVTHLSPKQMKDIIY